jgi:hypothetical protein
MPRLRQHRCLQAYALGNLAQYANPGRVMFFMPRLRQHSRLQAYALGDLAKYASPGKVLSLHAQA